MKSQSSPMSRLIEIPRPDYAKHPAYGELFGFSAPKVRIMALRRFYPVFRNELRRKRRFDQKLKKNKESSDSPLYIELREQGALALHISPEANQIARDLTRKAVEELDAHRAAILPGQRKFADSQKTLEGPEYGILHQFLADLLKSCGILDAASPYLGTRVEFRMVTLQINDDSDILLKHHFRDIGIPDPPTNYMHIDSTTAILKCIFYLTEVTEETGPFGYVLGSNNFNIGQVRAFRFS